MTVTLDRPTPVPPPTSPAATAAAPRLRQALGFELIKLTSQWRLRVVFALCLLAPAAFVAVVSQQSSLPADTVFGRWMSQSGWAGPLVVLAFGGSWALPLLTSLVAGDIFAGEDRLGTWRHLLVAVRSPRRIFLAKAVASLAVVTGPVVVLAASSIIGGLLAVGHQPLVGLDGHSLAPGDAAVAVGIAWLCSLAPTLAFAAVGLLGSVLFGRSPMGLVTPALLAVALNVAQLLPLPAVVRVALPGYAFIGWRGLFTDPAQAQPLVIGVVVSLVWAVVATGIAYAVFVRRDFTSVAHDGAGRRGVAVATLPLVVLLAVTIGVLSATSTTSGSGIGRRGVEASLATSFGHLYRLQSRELHRPDVTEAQLRSRASCDKGGSLVADTGPGNDWRCVVTWRIPGAVATGSAIYQLDLTPDGRYVADGDGPQSVNGFFQVRTDSGDAPNPLWQFDGLVDLLSRP